MIGLIGLIDPALLLPRGDDAEAEQRLIDELDEVLRICRQYEIEIPTFDEYWPQLWSVLGRPLERGLSPRARRALGELRKLGRAYEGPPLTAWRGRVYGFRQMFACISDASDWTDVMTRAVIRATSTKRPAVLLVRSMLERNLRCHRAGHSTIYEPTRWVMQLHVRGAAPRPVLCVHHRRNLQTGLRWTARCDWRLPAEQDQAKYPFCPPESWWKRDTEAVRTVKSRPVWLDCKGNAWARPNIPEGRGHHWDVYISDTQLAERIGLRQLNVVGFGGPASEGAPGLIHHVPTAKQSRLRDDAGWTC